MDLMAFPVLLPGATLPDTPMLLNMLKLPSDCGMYSLVSVTNWLMGSIAPDSERTNRLSNDSGVVRSEGRSCKLT